MCEHWGCRPYMTTVPFPRLLLLLVSACVCGAPPTTGHTDATGLRSYGGAMEQCVPTLSAPEPTLSAPEPYPEQILPRGARGEYCM